MAICIADTEMTLTIDEKIAVARFSKHAAALQAEAAAYILCSVKTRAWPVTWHLAPTGPLCGIR